MSRYEETNAAVQELEKKIRDNYFVSIPGATFAAQATLLEQIALSLADIADTLKERRTDI